MFYLRNGYSIARIVVCYAICLFFIAYFLGNVKGISLKTEQITQQEETAPKIESQESTTSSHPQEIQEEKPQEKEETQSQTVTAQTESVETSAAAIKGKIVTRYISPYTAPLSYENVYLKNSTPLQINLKTLLNQKIKFKIKENKEPQVLIMHTHTTETFLEKEADYYTEDFNSRTIDNSKNMVKIGSIIAEKLNANGIKTLHDKTKHDYPEYTGSYGRSAKTVKSYLKKYPSIKIVLDLHRDSVSEQDGKAKLVTKINGKKAAQVMLVMGSQSGSVDDYPNWQENLSLAVKLHKTIEENYPTLARPILFRSNKYNQNLTTGSMLIEFGTDVNTLDESCYSAELVGDSLVKLLKTLK